MLDVISQLTQLFCLITRNADVHWSTQTVIQTCHLLCITQHLEGCTQMSPVNCEKLNTCTHLHVQLHTVNSLQTHQDLTLHTASHDTKQTAHRVACEHTSGL